MNEVYEGIIEKYGYNQPVFLDFLQEQFKIDKNQLIKYLQKMIEFELLLKVTNEIYYIPRKNSVLKNPIINTNKIIERMYIKTFNEETIGYISEINFANKIGLTTQTASIQTITTNLANEYKETMNLNKKLFEVKKPKAKINNKNYKVLQSLEFLDEYSEYSEFSFEKTLIAIKEYLTNVQIEKNELDKYISLYSSETERNVKESGMYYELTQ